jgi:Fic family protein
MVSRSADAPVFEKLTLGQIAARTGLTEERSRRALMKLEELDVIRRGTDTRTDEEFFSAIPPEVQHVGLRRP